MDGPIGYLTELERELASRIYVSRPHGSGTDAARRAIQESRLFFEEIRRSNRDLARITFTDEQEALISQGNITEAADLVMTQRGYNSTLAKSACRIRHQELLTERNQTERNNY